MSYLEKIEQMVGKESVKTDLVDRICYSRDMSLHEGIPDAVVFAHTADEVAKILTLANEERFPVVPRGSGTSLTGAALPCLGGIRKTIMSSWSQASSVRSLTTPSHPPISFLRILPVLPCAPLVG